jgi:hypothetical protein
MRQEEFDYFLPERFAHRTWLEAREVAEMIGFNKRTVLRIAEETVADEKGRPTGIYKLERFTLDGRTDRATPRFTPRGVLLWLTECMANVPADFVPRLKRQLRRCGTAELRDLVTWIAGEISGRLKQ